MRQGLIKTREEIELIAEGGKLLREILSQTAALVRSGISTWELDRFADAKIREIGGVPSFLGYGSKKNPFPAALCTSVNSVVVHGIPSKDEILKDGDIISLDIGMEYKGLFTDTALTVPVGGIKPEAAKLIETTKQCLDAAIREVRAGARTGDLGSAIQSTAEKQGFSVVRDLVGHGVGYGVHEDPAIPCYGLPGTGTKLVEGMVIAIEPMVCAGGYRLAFESDGWTIRTLDNSLAAHFEHTIAVTKKGSRILT